MNFAALIERTSTIVDSAKLGLEYGQRMAALEDRPFINRALRGTFEAVKAAYEEVEPTNVNPLSVVASGACNTLGIVCILADEIDTTIKSFEISQNLAELYVTMRAVHLGIQYYDR